MRVRYSFSSRRTGKIEGTNIHRKPFPKIAKEVVDKADIVLEVLDARFIEKTRNKEIENYIKKQKKKIVYVINKSDFVDTSLMKKNIDLSELEPKVIFSCKNKYGKRALLKLLKIETKKLAINRKANIGIVGFPNTGKSSIINLLVGRKSAGTSSQAGFTKGVQKIRLNSRISIIDTPGIIPEEEYVKNKEYSLKKQAEVGIRTYDKVKEPDMVVHKIIKENPGLIEEFYNIKANGDTDILLEELGRKRKFLKKGNEVDKDRTARLVLKDWQEGKIVGENYR